MSAQAFRSCFVHSAVVRRSGHCCGGLHPSHEVWPQSTSRSVGIFRRQADGAALISNRLRALGSRMARHLRDAVLHLGDPRSWRDYGEVRRSSQTPVASVAIGWVTASDDARGAKPRRGHGPGGTAAMATSRTVRSRTCIARPGVLTLVVGEHGKNSAGPDGKKAGALRCGSVHRPAFNNGTAGGTCTARPEATFPAPTKLLVQEGGPPDCACRRHAAPPVPVLLGLAACAVSSAGPGGGHRPRRTH